MPGSVRFAVWLTFFNTWVLFEETVVDRYGLWEYMPSYRVGRLCSWDIGVMALLGFVDCAPHLSRHGGHPHAEKEQHHSTNPIHGLLRPLEELTDGRPIQREDEHEPERGAYQHHAEDE